MRLFSSVLFAVLAFVGCANPTDPASDLITARAANQTLQLTNTSNDKVYYFVGDPEKLALIDWAVCLDPAKAECTFIAPGATKRINYSEFLGTESSGTKAIVYHWRLIPKGTTYNYDSLRTLEVDLK
jgi:hypothetical protein